MMTDSPHGYLLFSKSQLEFLGRQRYEKQVEGGAGSRDGQGASIYLTADGTMAVTVSTLSRTSALEPGNAFAHDMVCLGEAGKWIGTLKFLGGPEQPMAVPADMASLLIEGRLSADQQASAVIAAEHLIETAKAESVSLAP